MVPAGKILEQPVGISRPAACDDSLVLPIEGAGNPAHEMQRHLLERIGAELGNYTTPHAARVDLLENIVSTTSRLAGPVGLVALVAFLGWLIL